MAKDTKKSSKDTKSKSSSSKDAKSSSSKDAKAKTSSTSSKPTTPSGRRPSGSTPSGTTAASATRSASGTRTPTTTPSTGAGVQRTNSGRQIGATPSTGAARTSSGSTRPPGTTPATAPSSTTPNASRAAPTAGAPGPAAAKTSSAAMPPSGYGSQAGMNPGGDSSIYGANSMYGNGPSGASGYGMGGQNPNSMYGANPGSMYGAGGGGSMYNMGSQQQPNSMYGGGPGGASGYGMDGQNPNSMYGANPGSMYGAGGGGSMYGMNTGYGSMGGMGGSQMGSMYGMGDGSMYGMNPMMGGSMYGMNPMMGSMYGMGGPMMGGSMYGMNPMMGSMYGMGGPMMGSMYGMGSMGSFGSYGGGSMYGSLGGGMGSLYNADVGDTGAGRVGGFFSSCKGPMSNDNDRLPVSGVQLKEDNRRLVRSTKKADEKERGLSDKDADKKDDDKSKGAADSKSRSIDAGDDKDAKKGGAADKDGTAGKASAADDKDAGNKPMAAKSRSLNVAGAPAEKEDETNATQTVVLVDSKADAAALKVEGSTITVNNAPPFTAMEVVKDDKLDVTSSKSLTDMVEHVAQGHNVSTVFFCTKDKSVAIVNKTSTETVKAVVARLSGDKEVKNLRINSMAAATSSPQKGKDLLDKNAEKELEFASNPIFGSCVQNLKKQVSTDASGVEKVMKTVQDYKVAPKELVVVQHIIQHNNAGGMYLSSLTFIFVHDAEMAEAVSISDDQKIPMHWLKTSLGGTSRLTVVLGLTGDKKVAEDEARYLKAAGTMSNSKNQAPRSGNVTRFIEYTEEQVKKREEAATNAKTPEEKATLKQFVDKMRSMVKDAKDFIAKPDSEPKMYPLTKHRDTTAEDGARSKSRGIDAVSAAGASTAAEPFTSIHRMAVVEGARAADSGNTVEVTVSGAKKAFDVDECISMAAADKEPGASKEMARLGGIFGNGCNVALLGAECVPEARPAEYKTWYFFGKLLADILSNADPSRKNEIQLYMSVVREREVLGDLLAAAPATAHGALVVAASPLFGPHVHNTSMRKLVKVSDVQPVLEEALKKAEPLMATDNAMIVATAALKQVRKDDVVVASLFAVSAKDMRPYEGVVDRDTKFSRSLFSYALGGPCSTELLVTLKAGKDAAVAPVLSAQRKVSHTKSSVPRCGSVKEFLKYTKNNKDRMAKKVEEATDPAERARAKAGLKRMEESEKDHESLLKDPANAELKSYAAEDGNAAKPHGAAAAADKAAGKAPTPSNAAHAQQRSLPTKPPTPSSATAAAASAQSPAKSRSPQAAGAAAPAAASPGRQNRAASPRLETKESESKRVNAEFMAIVTAEMRHPLETKQGWSVVGSDNKLVVTDVDGPHEFTVDELINRQSRSVPLNSPALDQLRDRFLSGYNVALLTIDARGSASSLELIDRTVRQVLGKADPVSEIFVSLCAYKERSGQVRDTMRDGTDFVPIEISSSPLSGPGITGATYDKVANAQEFVGIMDRGLRLCGESRACVFLHLVLCTPKPEENDVIVSSFLAVMCPGDISLYTKALKAPPKERGMLQFALGGPCYTLFAAGFTRDPVDEGCLVLSKLGSTMRNVSNTRSPGGSMKRFLEHTRSALQQLQNSADASATDEEKYKVKKYEDSVIGMIKDAESYIANPSGRLPAVYQK